MTVAAIQLNPNVSTVAAGTFGVQWDGLIQGTTFPDPSTRYAEATGLLSSTETIAMWGGVGIYENVPPAVTSVGLNNELSTPGAMGGNIGRALAITGGTKNLTGFSVFDQAYGMINTPQSPVPSISSYGQVLFYRLGSGARLSVACNSALAASLQGGLITQQVSWDFVNQQIIPYVAAYSADTVTDATWNSTTGVITFTLTTGGELSVGDVFTINGVVATGAGANGLSYNGTWTAIAGTSGTTLTAQGVPGTANNPGTYSSGGTLPAGGGAIPGAKILKTQTSNCMTINYNSTTGFLTWNYNGSAAVVQLGPAN